MAKRRTNQSKPDNYPTKRLKVNESGIKKKTAATTIFDLDDDCLVGVFCYLNQSDLVNVCGTDPRLRYASERAFRRNFAKIQTTVSTVRGAQQIPIELQNSLKLLQYFGHLMTKVLVMFKLENISEILESMVENCGENMNELEFCHLGVVIRQRVLYSRGVEEMNSFLGGLGQKFPNLHHLKLEYFHRSKICPYFNILLQHIPSLRSFSVAGASFSLDDILKFIRLNRQLECLSLVGLTTGTWINGSLHITNSFIDNVNAALPQLKSVEFSRVHIDYRTGYKQDRFLNVKKLSIGHFAEFTTFDGNQFSFAGKNIEEIHSYFNVVVHRNHLPEFVWAILKFKKLKRLNLHLMIHQRYLTPAIIKALLHQCMLIIAKNNQLMEVIVHLYWMDSNFDSTTLLTDHQYYEAIGSAFISSQWTVNKDLRRLVFTKKHQN